MVLAAAFALPTALFAQTTNPEKYEFDAQKGIGYNKYLVSNTPDADGNYTLRIENFITGHVKQTMTPADFVLVLDVSGSMQYDYKPRNTTVPTYIRKSANDALDDDNVLKLRLDDGQDRSYNHYAYTGYYAGGAVGAEGSGGYPSIIWAQAGANPSTSVGYTNRWFYYPEDATYYRIFRYSETINGQKCYYVYFDRVNSAGTTIERRYVVQSGNDIIATTDKPTNFHAEKTVMFIDNLNNSGYKLYRYSSRKDALKSGVDAFLELIKEENEKDEQWEEDVTRHQVSIVAFGSYKAISSLNEPSATDASDAYTKIAKIFREINAGNIDSYKEWDNKCTWLGGTYPYNGTNGAVRLLQNLQNTANMGPLNNAGGTNRAKIVVVFTDGEPSNATGVSGYSNARGNMNLTCKDGVTIKKTGWADDTTTPKTPNINGLIYTINLSNNTDYVPAFLEHLSSNYKEGLVSNGQTQGGSGTTFSGTKTGDGFYMDANDIDLKSAFKEIAKANTGAMTSTLVAVDVMSDSFQIPFTSEDTDKVTMYTAQCIGLKDVEGEEKLAFAQPIKVSERPALAKLWVVRENPTTHEPMWVNLGEENDIDIDNRMAFEIKQDSEGVGKTIIVSGFNYADLWCGEDLAHDNTRQIETDDPNFAYQKDGYRGFKLIFEFPIKLDPDALGGVNVPTNDWASSGLFKAGDDGQPTGNPEVNYPTPDLPVPVKLIIQKSGLQAGESANFTVQRRTRTEGSTWEDFTTFVLTGGVAIPEVRIINLDPAYFYKVKEGNWSWAYEAVSPEYSTEDTTLKNPIVFENTPEDDTPKHAEAKATNKMRKTGSTTESTD